MRRRLRKMAAIIVTLAAIAALALRFGFAPEQAAMEDVKITNEDAILTFSEYDRTKLFSAKDTEFLTFRLPSTATAFRISSQLIVPSQEILSASLETEYGYRVEWSGDTIGIESPRTISHLQSVSTGELPKLGRLDGSPTLTALPVKSFEVDLEDRRNHTIKVRASPSGADQDNHRVLLRVSVKQERSRRKLAYFWQRMRGDKRDELASTSIFGSASLSDTEREALFQNRWTPIGPTGVEGRNFQTELIYSLKEAPLTSENADPNLIPDRNTLLVSEHFRAVVPILGPDLYTIQAIPRNPSDKLDALTMHIYDKQLRRHSFRWRSLAADSSTQVFLPHGLVEISAEHHARLRIRNSERDLLEPEPPVIRQWDVSARPASFQLTEPSRLKLVARKGSALSETFRVTWQGENGPVTETFPLVDERSAYDRLIQGSGDFTVWEKSEFILTPPEWATEVSVSADAPVFLQFFKRPRALVHKTVVPDDYMLDDSAGDRQPVWFSARPRDYRQRIEEETSILLLTQPRLPDENLDLATGTYHWEELSETPSRQGTYFLMELAEEEEIREEAKAILYARVPMNTTITLDQASSPATADFPSRRLIYQRSSEIPVTLHFSTDLGPLGPPHICSAARGEIPFPPIPFGAKTLTISASDRIETFINYLDVLPPTHRKRFAQEAMSDRTYRLIVEKRTTEREVCTVRVFTGLDQNVEHPIRADVEIAHLHSALNIGSSDAFTPLTRTFLLREPSLMQLATPVHSALDEMKLWQAFFIPLGEDLPIGEYSLSLTISGVDRCFLSVTKITGGVFNKTVFRREAIRTKVDD